MNKIYGNKEMFAEISDKWSDFSKEDMDGLLEKGIGFKEKPGENDIIVNFKVGFTHKENVIVYKAKAENDKQALKLAFALEFVTPEEMTIGRDEYQIAIGGFAATEMDLFLSKKKIDQSVAGIVRGKTKDGSECIHIIHLIQLTKSQVTSALEAQLTKGATKVIPVEELSKEDNFDSIHSSDMPVFIALTKKPYTPREEWDQMEQIRTKLLGLMASRLAASVKSVVDEKDAEKRSALKLYMVNSIGHLMATLQTMKENEEIDLDLLHEAGEAFETLLEEGVIPEILACENGCGNPHLTILGSEELPDESALN